MLRKLYGGIMRLPLASLTVLTFFVLSTNCFGQSGNGGGKSQTGGQGAQSPQGGQAGAQNAGQTNAGSSWVEENMLAYEATNRIATHIAAKVRANCGNNCRVFVYDQATFANLQSYDAYAGEIAMLEAGYSSLGQGQNKALSDVVSAMQTAVATVAALRSSTEYSSTGLDLNTNTDPLIAQVAHYLRPNVVVPKTALLSQDGEYKISRRTRSDCADIANNVPEQLNCLFTVRGLADSTTAQFAAMDKLLQAFLQSLLGSAPPSSDNGNSAGAQPPSNPGDAAPPDNTANNKTPTGTVSPMAAIIAGHRLRSQLSATDSTGAKLPTRILVLEVPAAGGSSRVRHNFWVELFYTTPTPSFNGGAVVTYMVIDPLTSNVVEANTVRVMFKYDKFHNAEGIRDPETTVDDQ
jgi:hypothetical protein